MSKLRSIVRAVAALTLLACVVVVVDVAATRGGIVRFVCAVVVFAVGVSMLSKELR